MLSCIAICDNIFYVSGNDIVMAQIYKIVYTNDKQHSNIKRCKVISILGANYRVSLLSNSSHHIISKQTLKSTFEYNRRKC